MPRHLSRGQSASSRLSAGDLLDALGNDQRRTVLRLLVASDSVVGLQELAHEMAIGTELSVYDPTTIVTALRHVHLPRLDSLGIVEYDPDENVVRPLETVEELVPVLEYLELKRDE